MNTITERQRRWRAFLRNRISLVGVILVILVTLVSLFAPLIAGHDPLVQSAAHRLVPPDSEHIMGRDTYGRDVFARVLYAGRISLVVGVGAVAVGLGMGTLLGLVAGYSGGWVETVIMRFIDIVMAFPSLLLGLTVVAVLGSGMVNMILGIGLVIAPAFARIVHASTLTVKQQDFVMAARALGATRTRILWSHILPNVIGEVVVMGSLQTASAIRIEAGLSFIGLGVSPPTPTWGNMLREGIQFMTISPWLSIYPVLAILIAVLGFNLLGDGLRDVIDPRLR